MNGDLYDRFVADLKLKSYQKRSMQWAHLRLGAVEEGLFPFFGLFCEEAGAATDS